MVIAFFPFSMEDEKPGKCPVSMLECFEGWGRIYTSHRQSEKETYLIPFPTSVIKVAKVKTSSAPNVGPGASESRCK